MIVMDPTSTLINQQYVNVHATTKGDVHSCSASLLVEYMLGDASAWPALESQNGRCWSHCVRLFCSLSASWFYLWITYVL